MTSRSSIHNVAVLLALVLAVSVPAQKGKGGKGGGGDPPPPADPAIVLQSGGSIYVMNEDGSNVTLVLADAGHSLLLHPEWSPDATQVAFAGDPGGLSQGIWVVDVDGANLRKVADLEPGESPRPAWAPVPALDGLYKIAFTTVPFGQPSNSTEIFVVNLDGSGLTQLTHTAAEFENDLTWSPDATRLAYTNLLDVECVVLDLALGGAGELVVAGRTSLTDIPGSPFQGLSVFTSSLAWPDWSRNGDKIALSANGVPGGGSWDIWVIDLGDPANPTRVTWGRNSVERQSGWSPDDLGMVLWLSSKKDGIYRMNADGSGLARLVAGGKAPSWRRW